MLLAFGGSQGARPLNDAIAALLDAGLPRGLFLIWATGQGWYDRYATYESANVRVRPYLAPIQDAYAAADLALTRAGALTVAELCAWGIPSLLVPLPTAAADHQHANARALEAAGAAELLEQNDAQRRTARRAAADRLLEYTAAPRTHGRGRRLSRATGCSGAHCQLGTYDSTAQVGSHLSGRDRPGYIADAA